MTSPETNQDDGFRVKISTILLLTAIFLFNFTARVMLAPLLPTIEHNLHISHVQAGSLFFIIAVGYFFTMGLTGWISSRIEARTIVIISATALGAALISISQSHTLGALRLSLLFLGLAAGLYLSCGISIITRLVKPQNWGKALAVHELAPNIGLIMTPILGELFMRLYTWRMLAAVLGIMSIITALTFAKWGKGGNFKGESPKPSVIKSLMAQRSFWIIMALFSLGVGGSLGVYNMLTLSLVTEGGLDRGLANTMISLSRIPGIFMAFVSGWAVDRLGPKTALAIIMSSSGIATVCLGFLSGPSLIVMVFIQAALTASFFAAGLTALSLIGTPNQRTIVVSLGIPLGLVVGTAFPSLIGYMAENYSFAAGNILAGLLVLIGAPLSLSLRFKKS